MFSKTVYGSTFKDIHFVPLQSATFCIQCELISTNSRPYCLACGNTSLLSLSRVLGGTLRQQQTAPEPSGPCPADCSGRCCELPAIPPDCPSWSAA